MSGEIKPKMENHQEISSSIAHKKKDSSYCKPNNSILDTVMSYEVFRNNTTAVEVIVKDVIQKSKKGTTVDVTDTKLSRLQAEVDRLRSEMDNANKSLAKTRKGFQTVIREMRKQTEAANLRESDTYAGDLALKLENEKLRILLDSKTKLLGRIKKEMTTIKRVLKFAVTNICNAPTAPGHFDVASDTEYEEFENDLNKDIRLKFSVKTDKSDTFDTTPSRDRYFDKKE